MSLLAAISSVTNIDSYLSKREVASRLLDLLCSTPDEAVRVGALPTDNALCSWGRHITLTVSLTTQIYKWILANLMLGVIPAIDYNPIQGREEILLFASCYKNRQSRRNSAMQIWCDWTVFRLELAMELWRLRRFFLSLWRLPKRHDMSVKLGRKQVFVQIAQLISCRLQTVLFVWLLVCE